MKTSLQSHTYSLAEAARLVLEGVRKNDADDPSGREISATEFNAARQAVDELVRQQPKRARASKTVSHYEVRQLRRRAAELYKNQATSPADEAGVLSFTQALILLQTGLRDPELAPSTQFEATLPKSVRREVAALLNGPFLLATVRKPDEALGKIPPPLLADFERAFRLTPTSQLRKRSDKRQRFSEFLYYYFTKYADSVEVRQAQQQALREALENHGIEVGQRDPQAVLIKTSSKNRARLEARFPYELKTKGMEQAEAILSRLSTSFCHNSRKIGSTTPLPLLACREFQALGSDQLGNTFRFNKSFLKTDDHVFFFVDLTFDHRPVKTRDNTYGHAGLVLERKFATRHAHISPFVMYPAELFNLAAGQLPELAQQIRHEYEERFGVSTDGKNPFPSGRSSRQDVLELIESSPHWQQLRCSLGQFDLTVRDFEGLMRHQVLYELNQIRTQQPARFQHIVERLDHYSRSKKVFPQLNELFAQAVSRLGFQAQPGFEAKVPVAVPPAGIAAFVGKSG